jgi:hypothetical protein
MTEPAHISLFAEMDAAADALRRDNPELRESLVDELQMTFREIQKRRAPQLSTAEWVELFRVWGLEYAARCERQRDEAIAGMIATIDEFAGQRAGTEVALPVRRQARQSRRSRCDGYPPATLPGGEVGPRTNRSCTRR